MMHFVSLLQNRLRPADFAAKHLTFDERSFEEPSRRALRRALDPGICPEEEAAAKREKVARMVGLNQGMQDPVELTRAVYDVAHLFRDANFHSFLPCNKNKCNIDVGDVVLYQQDGDVPPSREVLCVAILKSAILCPVSMNKIFFCTPFGIVPEKKCFKAEAGPQMKVPYEHMRVKFMKTKTVEELDGTRIFFEDFDSLPPHKYFH